MTSRCTASSLSAPCLTPGAGPPASLLCPQPTGPPLPPGSIPQVWPLSEPPRDGIFRAGPPSASTGPEQPRSLLPPGCWSFIPRHQGRVRVPCPHPTIVVFWLSWSHACILGMGHFQLLLPWGQLEFSWMPLQGAQGEVPPCEGWRRLGERKATPFFETVCTANKLPSGDRVTLILPSLAFPCVPIAGWALSCSLKYPTA